MSHRIRTPLRYRTAIHFAATLAVASIPLSLASAEPLRVMPLGDSITYGLGSSAGGYRAPLYQGLTAAGFSFDFVGTRTDNSVGLPDPQHEGWGGHHIVYDAAPGTNQLVGDVVANALAATDPDVILLHIGTNDTTSSSDPIVQAQQYGQLLDQIHATEPNAKVLAAAIIPKRNVSESRVVNFNREVHEVVRQRHAAGYDVDWVGDMATAVNRDSIDLPDNIHPTPAAYAKMAAVWERHLTEPPTRPAVIGFDDRPQALNNFYDFNRTQVDHSTDDGGVFRYIDSRDNRAGSALFDPNDAGTNRFGDHIITADFRVSGAGDNVGLFARIGADDTGGYLAEIVFDDTGTTDVLRLYENPNPTPSIPTRGTLLATTNLPSDLQLGTFYTLRLTVEDSPSGTAAMLQADVLAAGQGGALLGTIDFVDATSPFLEAGQAGMRCGNRTANDVVDVDNFSVQMIPEPVSLVSVVASIAAFRVARRR